MILTINGIVVDATKELEMFRPELGYNCFIKLNDGRDDDYRYNCTEFHHLYKKLAIYLPKQIPIFCGYIFLH